MGRVLFLGHYVSFRIGRNFMLIRFSPMIANLCHAGTGWRRLAMATFGCASCGFSREHGRLRRITFLPVPYFHFVFKLREAMRGLKVLKLLQTMLKPFSQQSR